MALFAKSFTFAILSIIIWVWIDLAYTIEPVSVRLEQLGFKLLVVGYSLTHHLQGNISPACETLAWYVSQKTTSTLKDFNWKDVRADMRRLEMPIADDVQITDFRLNVSQGQGTFKAELFRVNTSSLRVILYLHGGGLIAGDCASYRRAVSWVARFSNMAVFVPEYRLSPEHAWPAQLDDCLTAFLFLVDQLHVPPKNIVVGGDSAGGGLTALLLLAIRDQPRFSQYTLPDGAFFISPYTDLSFSYPSIDTNKETDHWVRKSWLQGMADVVITTANEADRGILDAKDPSISPYYAELSQLVPIYMIVTDQEIMRDDGVKFHWKALKAGNPSRLDILQGFHAMHLFADHLPEGRDVIQRIARFATSPSDWVDEK